MQALKNRDAIVEKNKKAKAGKTEPVPALDNIEQITTKNDLGETVQIWVTIKNPQFKHLNLSMNNIDDDIASKLESCLRITEDEFGITLSSNNLSEKVINDLHSLIVKQHGNNVDLSIQQAEAEGKPTDELKPDQFIHLRRLAV